MDTVKLNSTDGVECCKEETPSSQFQDAHKNGCENSENDNLSSDCMKSTAVFHAGSKSDKYNSKQTVLDSGTACSRECSVSNITEAGKNRPTRPIILSPLDAIHRPMGSSTEHTTYRRSGNATKAKPFESVLRKRHTSANISSTFSKVWEHEENPKTTMKKKSNTKFLLLNAEESQEKKCNSSSGNTSNTELPSAVNMDRPIQMEEDSSSAVNTGLLPNTVNCSSLTSPESALIDSMETCSAQQGDSKQGRNAELPPPPIVPVEDEALVNSSDIWPRVGYSIISELTMEQQKYIPTPFLVSHDQTYLPLQVFLAEEGSLAFRPFTKLDRLKKRDQESKNRHGRSQYRDFSLKEITRDTDAQQMFNFVQTTSLSRQNSKTTRNGHHCKFQIQVLKTYVKQIDARSLIDCKLDDKSPIMRRKLKKFFIIDETWVATEARCSVIFGDTLSDTTSTRYCVKRLCPFAFHVAQVSVNKKGLVTNVSFDIKEAKFPTFQRIIIPVKEFFLTR